MSDYRVEVTVKNANLWNRIRSAGFASVAELSRACGVPQGTIGELLNMRVAAKRNDGTWRQAVEKIAMALLCSPEDLFNDQQATSQLKRNKAARDVSAEQVYAIMNEPTNSIEQITSTSDLEETIAAALDRLTDRERVVLELRFGMKDGHEWTLDEIADAQGVTRERIREIEIKALRRLRHPSLAGDLRFLMGYAESPAR